MNAARLARKWEEAGDNRIAMVEALADELADDFATKADLNAAVQQVQAEIHKSRADIIRWFAGLLLVHAFGVVALIRVFA